MRIQHIIVGLALCITAACGGGNSSPTAPTPTTPTPPPAPQIVQVAGLWGYTAILTDSTGGGCLSGFFRSQIGTTDTGTVQVMQQGSSLEAIVTSDSTENKITGPVRLASAASAACGAVARGWRYRLPASRCGCQDRCEASGRRARDDGRLRLAQVTPLVRLRPAGRGQRAPLASPAIIGGDREAEMASVVFPAPPFCEHECDGSHGVL